MRFLARFQTNESQGDSASKPRVAACGYPGCNVVMRTNPNGVAPNVTQPRWGWERFFITLPQGSSCVATLGFVTQSLWDCFWRYHVSGGSNASVSQVPKSLLSRNNFHILALVLLFVFTNVCAAENINLQTPPAQRPTNSPALSALLQTADNKPITTKRDWEKQRDQIKSEWLEVLGELPKKRVPLKPEFLQKENFDSFSRQYVRYQIEEDVFTDGYLFVPNNTRGKVPAIVVFHPTTYLQAKGVAGLAEEYAEEKRQGLQLAQCGYVVWCPRNYIFDEGTSFTNGVKLYTANAEKIIKRHPTRTGMTRMTFDALRAADFVESLPQVDKQRIGCIGHSLGAKVALYSAAFDPRYKATVSSEGGIGLKFSNWDAVWYLGSKIKEPGFSLDHHQLLSLAAPRAFLLLAGESEDGDKSWAFINAAQPIYQLYGKPENIGWFNHRQGHRYSTQARQVAEEFFDRHLKR
jgi:dienelactone hydrolase